MSVIAFIPARGGSKSILQKNIKVFCGKPLIFWNLQELQKSDVDEIIVATDSDEIKSIVNAFNFSKVKVPLFKISTSRLIRTKMSKSVEMFCFSFEKLIFVPLRTDAVFHQ